MTVSKGPDAFRTISEVAEELDLPQHVLRFWETRFAQIRPMKRGGGRRYYRPDDVDLLRGIRHLLYGEGYTIRGVQRILKEQGPRFVIAAGRGEVAGLAGGAAADRAVAGYEDAPHIEPRLDPAAFATGEAPAIEVDRDDHDSEEDDHPHGGLAEAARGVMRMIAGARAEAPAEGLSPDEIRRLQATLGDLLECKRLLDQAQ